MKLAHQEGVQDLTLTKEGNKRTTKIKLESIILIPNGETKNRGACL
ncbi:hypothetical protein APP_19990 [Aeribacillus pallidus]|nr:hypothetical protein APP_19990 [Aeribacillus pallidus]